MYKHTVQELQNKPKNIIQKAELLLKNLDDTSKINFVETILNFMDYKPPTEFSKILTRYVDDMVNPIYNLFFDIILIRFRY